MLLSPATEAPSHRLVVSPAELQAERPNAGGMAGTHDPNYQTLAGVGGEVFGEDKKKDGGGEGPKAPDNKDAKAGTHDPNYQTLAGIGGDCFGDDKKKEGGGEGLEAYRPCVSSRSRSEGTGEQGRQGWYPRSELPDPGRRGRRCLRRGQEESRGEEGWIEEGWQASAASA